MYIQGYKGEESSNQLLNYKKFDTSLEKLEMNNSNSLMRMNGRDWMMMMMEGNLMNPSPPPLIEAAYTSNINIINNNNNRPLKTLELFPLTATNLKEETTSAMSKTLHACSSQIFNN